MFKSITHNKNGKHAKALFALAMVCFFWGTTWLASKKGVEHMPALELAGMRQLIGGFCYVAYFLFIGTKLPKGKVWYPILILSFLNFAISNGLSTWGLKYISAGLGSIMGAIFPLWLVVIGLFLSKERIPKKAILGLCFGFGGVCIIFYEHLQDFLNKNFQFGIFISLIATWSWAFGTLYTKKQAANFNPYFSLGLQMVISGLMLFSISFADNSFLSVTEIPWQSWAAIGYLIVFGSIISFICYLYALQNLTTEQTSIYAYINPIVAVLLGSLLFNEKLTPFIAIGGLVTLLGVYWVNKAYKISNKERPETEGV
ncbi:MAG: drug/metabolite-transporting permease [Chitinophagaceae bacterium]|nr:MAG: drug/metabolite-transporting permease [Chitinophagaceae bacterium]